MTCNLKTLGLALVAAFATSVVAASAASAAGEFKAAEYPAHITGSQVEGEAHKFSTESGTSLTCAEATFNGELAAASTTASVTPAFGNCHVILLGATLPATFAMNGCGYTFHTGGSNTTATVDLACPSEKDVKVTIYSNATKHAANEPFCTLTLKAQTGLNSFGLSNMAGSPGDITANANVGGIAYTRTGSALCGSETGKTSWTGNTTFKADNSSGEPISMEVG